jgi:hypothetical protein
MSALTESVKNIVNKPQLTEQDKFILILYKRELSRYEYVPTIRRIVDGAKEVFSLLGVTDNNGNKEKGDLEDGI